MTSQLVTAYHPKEIKTLTLLGSGTHTSVFNHDFTSDEFDEQWRRDWASITVEDPNMQKAVLAYALQADPAVWARTLNGVKYFDSSSELSKITCPVQIIWGTLDHCFSEEKQKELKKGLSSAPYIRFVEMVGKSHCPNWESLADNEELFRLIDSFIR